MLVTGDCVVYLYVEKNLALELDINRMRSHHKYKSDIPEHLGTCTDLFNPFHVVITLHPEFAFRNPTIYHTSYYYFKLTQNLDKKNILYKLNSFDAQQFLFD